MICAVPGCSAVAKRFGRYCNTHAARDRRHGHPLQQGVRAVDLRPYREAVRRRIQKNAGAPAWQTLEDTWRQAVERCQARLDEYRTGKPAIRWQRQAWEEVVKLAQEVEPREVIETVAAMYVMQPFDARRFRSDRAFWFQLVRRTRSLAEVNVGAWFDPRTERMKRVYRDLPPRVIEAMARIIVEAIGVAGARIAQLELRDGQHQADQRAKLHEELAEIT